jgi:hypothetical protein
MPINLQIDEPKRKLDSKDGALVVEEINTSSPIIFRSEYSGALANDPATDNIFEIAFPDEEDTVKGITLGFKLDKKENLYNLSYALWEGKKYNLDFTGIKPHLLIYYKTNFNGEVFVQGFDARSRPSEPSSGVPGQVQYTAPRQFTAPQQVTVPPQTVLRQTGVPQQVTVPQQVIIIQRDGAPQTPVSEYRRQQPPATPAPPPAPGWKPNYNQSPANVTPQIPTADNYQNYRVQAGAYNSNLNAQEAYNHLSAVGLTRENGFNLTIEQSGGITRVALTGVLGVDLPQVAQFCGYAGFQEILAVRE